jgi:hypothetical protein
LAAKGISAASLYRLRTRLSWRYRRSCQPRGCHDVWEWGRAMGLPGDAGLQRGGTGGFAG